MNRTQEKTVQEQDWQRNWQEDDLPDEVRRRTLARIYLMAIIILGIMFAVMGLQFTMLNDSTVTYLETEGERITISFVPPDELAVTQTTTNSTENKETISHETQENPVSVEQETYVYYNVPLSDDIQRYTQDICEIFGVQYTHVLATMKQESQFTPSAISPINHNGSQDWGIMQINSGNHKWLEEELGITDWLDIRQNILAGIYILSHYYYHGDHFQAIAMCYNIGPSRGQYNYKQGIYTTYSYEALAKLEELEESHENLRTETE